MHVNAWLRVFAAGCRWLRKRSRQREQSCCQAIWCPSCGANEAMSPAEDAAGMAAPRMCKRDLAAH
eukprot:4462906-Amphidinium_carterae.1